MHAPSEATRLLPQRWEKTKHGRNTRNRRGRGAQLLWCGAFFFPAFALQLVPTTGSVS
jgi:hypothetical protein